MANVAFPPVLPTLNLTCGEMMDILKDIPRDAFIKFVDLPDLPREKSLLNIYLSYDLTTVSDSLYNGSQPRYLTFVLH